MNWIESSSRRRRFKLEWSSWVETYVRVGAAYSSLRTLHLLHLFILIIITDDTGAAALMMMMNEQMHPFIMRNRGRGKERREGYEEDAGFIHHSTV